MAELEKLSGAIVNVAHLTAGDYCIDEAVLIERKTAADFAQSLIDGRLFCQAGRMSTFPSATRLHYRGGECRMGRAWRVARGIARRPGNSHADI